MNNPPHIHDIPMENRKNAEARRRFSSSAWRLRSSSSRSLRSAARRTYRQSGPPGWMGGKAMAKPWKNLGQPWKTYGIMGFWMAYLSSVQFGWKMLEDAWEQGDLCFVFCLRMWGKTWNWMAQKIKAWQNSCWTYFDQTKM
jgi:hypothetical protein